MYLMLHRDDSASPRDRLIEGLNRRKCKPKVRDRVLRLNKAIKNGERIRGWHRKASVASYSFEGDLVSKRAFLKRWGREAWAAMPNGLKHKNGRRRFIARTLIEDEAWLPWLPDWQPPKWAHDNYFVGWFPTKAYANDPNLEVETLPWPEFARRKEGVRHGI